MHTCCFLVIQVMKGLSSLWIAVSLSEYLKFGSLLLFTSARPLIFFLQGLLFSLTMLLCVAFAFHLKSIHPPLSAKLLFFRVCPP